MEAYSLPITIRRWFLERLVKQFEDEKKQQEEAAEKAKRSRR
jgi:hypothetical protein